jgi:predicted nucleotidyltransferase
MLPDPLEAARAIAARHPGLAFLLAFGSRARGDAGSASDWDFAFMATGPLEIEGLRAELSLALGTDRVDLVDLARAGGLLRFRAARDGVLLEEGASGSFARFWLDAVRFWCDARTVLEPGYEAVLAKLGP